MAAFDSQWLLSPSGGRAELSAHAWSSSEHLTWPAFEEGFSVGEPEEEHNPATRLCNPLDEYLGNQEQESIFLTESQRNYATSSINPSEPMNVKTPPA